MIEFRKYYLSEEQWEAISGYFPQKRGKKGFDVVVSNRDAFEGILNRYRTGIPWRDLPEGYGKWETVYQRFRRWSESGVIETVLGILQDLHGVELD